ncbi:MAG: hypothetical protein WAT79_11885 [Saprospiraceae bacterium]
MTELKHDKKTLTLVGYVSIFGSVSMLIGAGLWGSTGTDLWQSLATNQMDTYLNQIEPVKQWLVANTIFWTVGVLLLGIAGSFMSKFCVSNPQLALFQLVFVRSAVPMAIVSFVIMLSLAIHPPNIETAYLIGWIGTRIDDIATILIIGVSPLFLSMAGKSDWVPRWLLIWGYLAGFSGFLAVISLLTGQVALGFIIIPIGIGWMIAAGVAIIKKGNSL